MKSILSVIIPMLITFGLSAQNMPIDDETGLITYKEIVAQKASRQILYERAEAWVKTYYKNPYEVLGQRSAEQGFMNCKAIFRIHDIDKKGTKTAAGIITYTFRIEFKDDRYRFIFNNFQFQSASRFPLERWLNESQYQTPTYKSYILQIDQHILETIKNLEKGMEEPEKKTDEW